MLVSPKRVLWPTDFSVLSMHGGRYARGFCELFGAEMHIVHIIPTPLTPDASVIVHADVPMTVSEPELTRAAREAIEQIVRDEFDADPKIRCDALVGNAWNGVCTYAKNHEIDLIVVATHGHTGFRHVLIGSTAERIVQHAPCPVLTVKDPEREFLIDDETR